MPSSSRKSRRAEMHTYTNRVRGSATVGLQPPACSVQYFLFSPESAPCSTPCLLISSGKPGIVRSRPRETRVENRPEPAQSPFPRPCPRRARRFKPLQCFFSFLFPPLPSPLVGYLGRLSKVDVALEDKPRILVTLPWRGSDACLPQLTNADGASPCPQISKPRVFKPHRPLFSKAPPLISLDAKVSFSLFF